MSETNTTTLRIREGRNHKTIIIIIAEERRDGRTILLPRVVVVPRSNRVALLPANTKNATNETGSSSSCYTDWCTSETGTVDTWAGSSAEPCTCMIAKETGKSLETTDLTDTRAAKTMELKY